MLLNYQAVYRGNITEISEKKSRFIAATFPIETEAEAVDQIERIKKEHWNASHNCYAYVLGEQFELQRYSDDGEPGGTAGRPILDVLLGEQIHNTLIVVTRYFGGVKLGTGGLVRAYSAAAKAGLTVSTIITKISGSKLIIETDYNGLGKIQYILGQRGLTILTSDYTEAVRLEVMVPQEELAGLQAELIEKTNGQVQQEIGDASYFAEIDGEVTLFR